MDRRVRRTRKMLSEALFSLLQEKEYEAITIQEITDRADVHRATFYLHFATKEELLATSLTALFVDLETRKKAEYGNHEASFLQAVEAGQMIFEHVAEYSDLYKVLIGQRGVGYVTHQIIAYLSNIFVEKLHNDFPNENQLPGSYTLMARHLAGSLYAIATWWLETGMQKSPREMAILVHQLGVAGVGQYLV